MFHAPTDPDIQHQAVFVLSCIKIVTISQSVNEAVSCQQEGVIQFSYCWPNISQSLMNQPIAYKKVVYNCFLVDLTYVLICSFSRSHHQQYVVQITECEALFTITNYICALQPDITAQTHHMSGAPKFLQTCLRCRLNPSRMLYLIDCTVTDFARPPPTQHLFLPWTVAQAPAIPLGDWPSQGKLSAATIKFRSLCSRC